MVKAGASTGRMVRMAILIAIVVLMGFTPLGFLKTAGLEITFILIPVVVGAIILGPSGGAVLGGAFGVVSFIQCFGMSAFGATLLAIDPFRTLVVCLIPRILCGWLAGLIFKALSKGKTASVAAYALSALSCALLNTLFFMSSLMLLFGNTEFIMSMRGEMSIIPFVLAFVGVNGLIEAVVCFVIGGALSKALNHIAPLKAATT